MANRNKLFGITYSVGKVKFQFLLYCPKWLSELFWGVVLPINNKVAPQPVEDDDDDGDYGYGGDDGDDGAIFPAEGLGVDSLRRFDLARCGCFFLGGGSPPQKNCYINERHFFAFF